MQTQTNQFNAQVSFQRDQWNATNKQAVEQSNVDWRRQSNTINSAATNAANQANAQMAYGVNTAEQSFLWQNLRDEASYVRQSYENDQQRKATLYATALANEGASGSTSGTQNLMNLATSFFTKI